MGSRFRAWLRLRCRWAQFAAATIQGDLRGKPREAFHYCNKGNLATIGRSSAVADVRGFKLSGFTAWITWLLVHVLFLIGFRSRVQVLWEWFWSYVTFQRGARLITGHQPLDHSSCSSAGGNQLKAIGQQGQ